MEEEDGKIIQDLNAKRHAIVLNGLSAKRKSYNDSISLTSKDLADTELKGIGVFFNIVKSDEVEIEDYECNINMIVNGTESIQISRLNEESEFPKMIRYSKTKPASSYIHYIDETIKSAVLEIELKNSSDYPVSIANIKIVKEQAM